MLIESRKKRVAYNKSEELKKECQMCGSDNCHAWEAELAELLDENKPTKIRDFVRFLLAKQQADFVKMIPEEKDNKCFQNNPPGCHYECDCSEKRAYNQCIADIKSKLNK